MLPTRSLELDPRSIWFGPLLGEIGAAENVMAPFVKFSRWQAVSQPRDDRQDDLFGPSLDQIINLRHPLVRLAAEIDWAFLAGRFSSVCRIGPGQPPLPKRLVAGLLILKHMHDLSDETLCDRWAENPYFQYCGGVPARGAIR
jgi:hypothetical protein